MRSNLRGMVALGFCLASCLVHGAWTFEQSAQYAGTLTDGNWILHLTRYDLSGNMGSQITNAVCKTGGVLDLRPVLAETKATGGTAVNINRIGDKAFKGNVLLTDFIANTNLHSIGASAFQDATALQTVDLTACTNKFKQIGGSAFQNAYAMKLKPFLPPLVSSIGKYSFYKAYQMSGTVSLPSVTAFSEGEFMSSSISGAQLSPSLTKIVQSFCQATSLVRVAPTWPSDPSTITIKDGTVTAQSFYGCPSLRDVTFPFRGVTKFTGAKTFASEKVESPNVITNITFWGKPPTFATTSTSSYFAGDATHVLDYELTFTAPRGVDDASWTAFATAATDEEKARADYPGDAVTLGTFTLPEGGRKVWVVWGYSPYGTAMPTEVAIRASVETPVTESVSVSCTGGTASVPSASGLYPIGATVTLTASTGGDPLSTFRYWRGDLPDGVASNANPIAFTVDAERSLEAVFYREWAYAPTDASIPEAGILSNGVWTFSTTKLTDGESAISAITKGGGVLDLRNVADDTERNSCVRVCVRSLNITAVHGKIPNKAGTIRAFFAPPELRHIGESQFDACTKLSQVVLTDGITNIQSSAFKSCSVSGGMSPFLPGCLVRVGANLFWGVKALRGELALPSIESIDNTAFTRMWGLESVSYSPFCTNIGTSAFSDSYSISKIVARDLAEGEQQPRDQVGVVGATAFSSGLRTLVLPFRGGTVFRAKALKGANALAEMYFWGAAPTFDDKDTDFSSVADYQLKVYAPQRVDEAGWQALATPLTDAEKARWDYPGPKTFGTMTFSGKKVWLVWWKSPLSKRGLAIIVR